MAFSASPFRAPTQRIAAPLDPWSDTPVPPPLAPLPPLPPPAQMAPPLPVAPVAPPPAYEPPVVDWWDATPAPAPPPTFAPPAAFTPPPPPPPPPPPVPAPVVPPAAASAPPKPAPPAPVPSSFSAPAALTPTPQKPEAPKIAEPTPIAPPPLPPPPPVPQVVNPPVISAPPPAPISAPPPALSPTPVTTAPPQLPEPTPAPAVPYGVGHPLDAPPPALNPWDMPEVVSSPDEWAQRMAARGARINELAANAPPGSMVDTATLSYKPISQQEALTAPLPNAPPVPASQIPGALPVTPPAALPPAPITPPAPAPIVASSPPSVLTTPADPVTSLTPAAPPSSAPPATTLPAPLSSLPPAPGPLTTVQPIDPTDDLRSKAVLPGNDLDRFALAQQKAVPFLNELNSQRFRDDRLLKQRAAALGQLNSGMLQENYGNLDRDYNRRVEDFATTLLTNALEGTITDARANRGEIRGERDYQVGQESSAFDRGRQQVLDQAGLESQQLANALGLANFGYGGNPSNAGFLLGGQRADDASAYQQMLAALAGEQARAGGTGTGTLGTSSGSILDLLKGILAAAKPGATPPYNPNGSLLE